MSYSLVSRDVMAAVVEIRAPAASYNEVEP
jgi:hypothetical protein